jgi:hypothetical protein
VTTASDPIGRAYWRAAPISTIEIAGTEVITTSAGKFTTTNGSTFTPAGYVKGADLFVDVLVPVIDKLQVRPNIAAGNDCMNS